MTRALPEVWPWCLCHTEDRSLGWHSLTCRSGHWLHPGPYHAIVSKRFKRNRLTTVNRAGFFHAVTLRYLAFEVRLRAPRAGPSKPHGCTAQQTVTPGHAVRRVAAWSHDWLAGMFVRFLYQAHKRCLCPAVQHKQWVLWTVVRCETPSLGVPRAKRNERTARMASSLLFRPPDLHATKHWAVKEGECITRVSCAAIRCASVCLFLKNWRKALGFLFSFLCTFHWYTSPSGVSDRLVSLERLVERFCSLTRLTPHSDVDE